MWLWVCGGCVLLAQGGRVKGQPAVMLSNTQSHPVPLVSNGFGTWCQQAQQDCAHSTHNLSHTAAATVLFNTCTPLHPLQSVPLHVPVGLLLPARPSFRWNPSAAHKAQALPPAAAACSRCQQDMLLQCKRMTQSVKPSSSKEHGPTSNCKSQLLSVAMLWVLS